MIHCTLTDLRTVLIEEDELVTGRRFKPDPAETYYETLECSGSDLPNAEPNKVRYVQINRRGAWYPVGRVRQINEGQEDA
jgi:hypothetical protein